MKSAIRILCILGLVCIGPVTFRALKLVIPSDPESKVCAQIEFLVQEASQCVAYPASWNAWSKSKESYGLAEGAGLADASNCDAYIEKAVTIGISYEQLEMAGNWMRHEHSVRTLWNDVLEYDFCEYADDVGWTSRFKSLEE